MNAAILDRDADDAQGENVPMHMGVEYDIFKDVVNPLKDRMNLDIRDGLIHYKLYRQDGTMQPMTLKDTTENRYYVSWFKAHDRY